jgi:hypothetical protein
VVACGPRRAGEWAPARASLLPDISGLAWIGGDRFLAVHDAKYPDEAGFPRIGLLDVPRGLEGIRWRALAVEFGELPASDLEGAALVPDDDGRVLVLVAESTEEVPDKPFTKRLFLIEVTGDETRVVDQAAWPVPTANVEGIAVAASRGALLFLYAERGHGQPSTEIRWAELTLDPLRFGSFRSAGAFASPGPTSPDSRPVSALEIDPRGVLYAASSEDPDDSGPFRSAVYRIGRVVDADGVSIELEEPALLGTLDGLKVEALAARERPDGTIELWVGVDDEVFGGTLRPLPRSEEDD